MGFLDKRKNVYAGVYGARNPRRKEGRRRKTFLFFLFFFLLPIFSFLSLPCPVFLFFLLFLLLIFPRFAQKSKWWVELVVVWFGTVSQLATSLPEKKEEEEKVVVAAVAASCCCCCWTGGGSSCTLSWQNSFLILCPLVAEILCVSQPRRQSSSCSSRLIRTTARILHTMYTRSARAEEV